MLDLLTRLRCFCRNFFFLVTIQGLAPAQGKSYVFILFLLLLKGQCHEVTYLGSTSVLQNAAAKYIDFLYINIITGGG